MEKEEPSPSADESESTTTSSRSSNTHNSSYNSNTADSLFGKIGSKRPGSVAFPSLGSDATNSDSSPQVVTSSEIHPGNSSSQPNSVSRSGLMTPLKRDDKNLSEKKIRRLEKNRLSARNCRRKKKEYTQNLQHEINVLESENLKLRLQLQIGREAELSVLEEQARVTEELDALLKSNASDSDVFESIEEFKERFADYGRDRRSAIEYHLRNVERLLMPTTTTSVAIRALQDGIGNLNNSQTNVPTEDSKVQRTQKSIPSTPPINDETSVSNDPNDNSPMNNHTSKDNVSKMDPKNMFQYLVNFLNVTPEQASVLRDSRFVAKELDSALVQALSTLQQLRERLSTIGQDLEHEFSEIRSILTSRQSAKFLVWVANNAPAMHMLNEVWSGIHSVTSLNGGSNEDDPTST